MELNIRSSNDGVNVQCPLGCVMEGSNMFLGLNVVANRGVRSDGESVVGQSAD